MLTPIRSCLFSMSLVALTGCGIRDTTSSTLKSFTTLILTANNSDSSLRIGYDPEQNKIASFGNTVGSEFVISTYNNNAVWTTLSYPRELAGAEVLSQIAVEFGRSSMPVYMDEFPGYQSDMNDAGCGNDFEFKGRYNDASFQVRVRFTANGLPQVKTSDRIVFGHGSIPSKVEIPIYVTGSGVKDLVVELGAIQPRVAMGYCRYWEDQGSWQSKSFYQGTVFDLRISKITIPYAVNKIATPK